jgi:hypothetical protein
MNAPSAKVRVLYSVPEAMVEVDTRCAQLWVKRARDRVSCEHREAAGQS